MYPYVPHNIILSTFRFGLNYSVTMIGLQKKVFFQFILDWEHKAALLKGIRFAVVFEEDELLVKYSRENLPR